MVVARHSGFRFAAVFISLAACETKDSHPVLFPCPIDVQLSTTNLALGVGQEFVVTANYYQTSDCQFATRTIDWQSQSGTVASVTVVNDTSARIRGLAVGNTYVKAVVRADPGLQDSVRVVVQSQ